MKTKLVYILPEYRASMGSHFYHKYEFLKKLDGYANLVVVVEKGERPQGLKNVYVQQFTFLPLRALELFFMLLKARINGYKTFWVHYSFLGGILAPLFGRGFYWNCGMPWLYRRNRLEEFFFSFSMKRAELVTGTDSLARSYAERYGLKRERVHVLPNWIDLERYAPWRGRKKEARRELNLDAEKKIILFVHRLSRRKGANLIVPIAEHFRDDPSILFLVVGAGPLSEVIRGSNIMLAGEVPQLDMPKYFAAADIFFMPSEEEGFPHVLLEAMAAGIPFVASDVGGVADITPESARRFVVRQDIYLFQERICELLHNTSLCRTLGDVCIEHASRYDQEIVLNCFIELIA